MTLRQRITKSPVDIFPTPANGQKFLRDSNLRGFAKVTTASLKITLPLCLRLAATHSAS